MYIHISVLLHMRHHFRSLYSAAILGQSTTTADDSGNVWKTQTTSTNSFVGRFKAVLAGQARDLVRNTKN